MVNSGVKNECDPALALLSDYVQHNSNIMRLGSIVGCVQLCDDVLKFRLGVKTDETHENVVQLPKCRAQQTLACLRQFNPNF